MGLGFLSPSCRTNHGPIPKDGEGNFEQISPTIKDRALENLKLRRGRSSPKVRNACDEIRDPIPLRIGEALKPMLGRLRITGDEKLQIPRLGNDSWPTLL